MEKWGWLGRKLTLIDFPATHICVKEGGRPAVVIKLWLQYCLCNDPSAVPLGYVADKGKKVSKIV